MAPYDEPLPMIRVCLDVSIMDGVNVSSNNVSSSTSPPSASARIVMALPHASSLPQFTENFRCLCTGERGTWSLHDDEDEDEDADGGIRGDHVPLTYSDTLLMAITHDDYDNSQSGSNSNTNLHFGHLKQRRDAHAAAASLHIADDDDDGDEDEPMGACAFAADPEANRLFDNAEEAALSRKHNESGLVSMEPHARDPVTGAYRYGSRFVITLGRCPSRDGRGVVVGHVLFGFGVLREIEALQTGSRSQPLTTVRIVSSDEVVHAHDDGTLVQPDGDPFQRWPADHPNMANSQYGNRAAAALQIKEFGNESFKRGEMRLAIEKYEKALRYLDKQWTAGMVELAAELEERNVQVVQRVPLHLNLSLCWSKLAEELAKSGDASGSTSCWRRAVETAGACEAAVAEYNWGIEHGPGMGLLARADIKGKQYSLDRASQLKMYTRRGRANAGLRQWSAAVADLAKASALDPGSASIRRELEVARRGAEKRKARTAQGFAAAFHGGLYASSSPSAMGPKPPPELATEESSLPPMPPPKQQKPPVKQVVELDDDSTSPPPLDDNRADDDSDESRARAEALAARLSAFLEA